MTETTNTKTIAKNTLLLYGRMLMLMLISLYSSRVILSSLGVEDYGIYNVVGGMVSMFSIVTGSLSASISRYITFELGRGDAERLRRVFCTSVTILILLILLVTLLIETVGLWFLHHRLVIPADRMTAAGWVFQFSVLTFAVNLWNVPYYAAIIAHERMSAFAYISIFEALAKLAICFIILHNPFDRLVYYALLMLLVGLLVRVVFSLYCKRKFAECSYRFTYDKSLVGEMFQFAGWNFIGASSAILRDQGGTILTNLFFGPVVNAARGIAMSVSTAINGFVQSFMTALNPQIIKSYAQGDSSYMMQLIFQGSRFSYYILLLLCLPILTTTPFLLDFWLETVPDHAVNFTRLVLIYAMSESLSGPLVTACLASGKIRNYQIVVGGCQILNIPLSYVLLRAGYEAEWVLIVTIFLSVCCEMLRLYMLRSIIGLQARAFLRQVYLNVIVVTLAAALLPAFVAFHHPADTFTQFLLLVTLSLLAACASIYFVGCNRQDREYLHTVIRKFLKRTQGQ